MCGKVQCTNVDLTTIPPGAHVSIQVVEGFTCINADFNLGTDVLDPAYVNPGSPCDKGKVKEKEEEETMNNEEAFSLLLCVFLRPASTSSV